MINEKTILKPKQRKLLKEMFERMEEMLTDDVYERYMPGETTDTRIAVRMWKKDVDTFCSLCSCLGFRSNKKKMLKKGDAWWHKTFGKEVKA